MLNTQIKVRGFPQYICSYFTVNKHPFIQQVFTKHCLKSVPRKHPRQRCAWGRLTGEYAWENSCKGLRETELVRKGWAGMNLPQRALPTLLGALKLSLSFISQLIGPLVSYISRHCCMQGREGFGPKWGIQAAHPSSPYRPLLCSGHCAMV